jgi:DNA replication protein DnaC
MLTAAQSFCFQMLSDASPHWLSFLGASGNGKTHLAKWILYFARCRCSRWMAYHDATGWRIAERFFPFWDWRKCVEKMRNGEHDMIEGMSEEWFCVVDDIGAEDSTGFSKAKLDDLCNRRMGKWTIFTANLSLEQIADNLDSRIASRMNRDENVVIQSDALDYSLRK